MQLCLELEHVARVLLAVDIGNTNITCGVFDGADLVHTFRIETRRSRTTDEHAVLLTQLLAMRKLQAGDILGAVVASVVPPLTDSVTTAIRLSFGVPAVVVGPGVRTGISVLCQNSHEVGADRIVNAVAAREIAGGLGDGCGAIVVDFGTATTFDCVSPHCEYLGGAIVPGIQVSLDGLLSRAAKLHPIELVAPPRVVGKNTAQALQSGVVYGYASLVDGLVARLRDELGFPCKVVATGGLAPLLARHAQSIDQVEPHLTLYGLERLFRRNAAATPASP